MFRTILFSLLLLLTASATNAQDAAEPLRIVTTTTQATDLTTIIGGNLIGDTIALTPLMGAGVDPHLYQPKERDIAAMSQADVIVYMGLNLEGRFGELFESLAAQDTRIIPLSQPVKDGGFTIGGYDLSEEFTNVDDPHFWFDPRNWQLSTQFLADSLSQIDPANEAVYQSNAADYMAQLDELYQWGLEAVAVIPEQQRVLITSHDAFQYFGIAFDFQVRGLQGISTADEAGVGDVQELADFVAENQIPVMFVESSVPPTAIEAVKDAVRARDGSVDVGIRPLYSDAMDSPDVFGGTYIGMIASNIITILQSFGEAVPTWPADLNPEPPTELLELPATNS
jgi:manganese/zinc/iron transport system substrate-binding protein